MGPSKGMPIASSARQKSFRKQTEPLQRGEWRMCANARNRCAIARWSGALLEAYSPRVHPALPHSRAARRARGLVFMQASEKTCTIRGLSICNKNLRAEAVYSITSSTRAISEGGIVRPSSFAVLRLIVSRTLVACSTGRSLGLAPRLPPHRYHRLMQVLFVIASEPASPCKMTASWASRRCLR